MTYDEFKAYLARYLWKDTDQALIADLDNLIKQANAELQRRLAALSRLETSVTLELTTDRLDLPADFWAINLIATQQEGPYTRVTSQQMAAHARNNISNQRLPIYNIVGREIIFAYTNAGSTDPLEVLLEYRQRLPDYQTTQSSWFADDYLDVYVNTVLKQTAPFLREDERVALWGQLSDTGIDQILEDDAHNVDFGGDQLALSVPQSSTPPGRTSVWTGRNWGR